MRHRSTLAPRTGRLSRTRARRRPRFLFGSLVTLG
ncbi:MAG: hypothetical protein QOJ68_3353, partial [Blastococcus sp.]|nr:hypothetical protein [Blastococcus sp.]